MFIFLLNHILQFCTHNSFSLLLKYQMLKKSVLISAICRCADSCLSTIIKIGGHILDTLTNHSNNLHSLTSAECMCKFKDADNL
jgi:hypothetical protein